MKTLFTLFATLFMASAIQAQLFVTNDSGEMIMLQVTTSPGNPNMCPPPAFEFYGMYCIPNGAEDFPISVSGFIHRIEAYQVNACGDAPLTGTFSAEVHEGWNPACYFSFGPLTIDWLAYAFGSGETHIAIY